MAESSYLDPSNSVYFTHSGFKEEIKAKSWISYIVFPALFFICLVISFYVGLGNIKQDLIQHYFNIEMFYKGMKLANISTS